MSRKTYFALGIVALALVVTAGGLMASNMGFKLNAQFFAQGSTTPDGASFDGTGTLGLPYNQQLGLDTALDLVNDIGGLTSSGGPVFNVQRFVRSNNSLDIFAGGRGTGFDLDPTTGVRVRVQSDVNYIVVGSHDPGKQVTMWSQGAATPDGPSFDGTNFFSYPYHSTSSNALDLANELGGLTGAGGPVFNVQRFVKSNNSLEVFAGGRGSGFTLVPGEAYRVRLQSTATFTPAHF